MAAIATKAATEGHTATSLEEDYAAKIYQSANSLHTPHGGTYWSTRAEATLSRLRLLYMETF